MALKKSNTAYWNIFDQCENDAKNAQQNYHWGLILPYLRHLLPYEDILQISILRILVRLKILSGKLHLLSCKLL